MSHRQRYSPVTSPRFVAALVGIVAMFAPVAASAQPDAWVALGSQVRVETLDRGRPQQVALSGGCFGALAASADRRLLLAPTSAGLAIVDSETRAVTELLPGLVDCSDVLAADPTGRWWYAVGAQYTPVRNIPRLRVIDAVAHRLVSETLETPVRKVAFDPDGGRYELLQLTPWPAATYSLRRAAAGQGSAAWEVPLEGEAADVAATASAVFVLVRSAGESTLLRLSPETGAETGRVRLTDLVGQDLAGVSVAVRQSRVYIALTEPPPASASPTLSLVSLDAESLDAPAVVTETFAEGWSSQAIVVADGAPLGYRVRGFALLTGGTGAGTGRFLLTNVAIDTIDLESLATMHTWSPILLPLDVVPNATLGQINVPGAPRVTALTTTGGRVHVQWRPDAAGAVPRQFVVRGRLRGQAAAFTLATLDADAHAWESPAVPPGEYVLELAAANAAGEGPAASVEIGIATAGTAGAPADLAVESAGGPSVRLSWTAPQTGPLPAGYVVEAAPAGGAFVPIAQTALPWLTVSGVPAGTWDVRVRALITSGAGEPSAAATVQAASCGDTSTAPRGLAALAAGSRVTVQWDAPPAGPPAAYRIDVAADAAGTQHLASLLVDGTQTAAEIAAPRGTFVVSVAAVSACGGSASSTPTVVRVR